MSFPFSLSLSFVTVFLCQHCSAITEVHPAFGEMVVCATVSPQLCVLLHMQVQWYLRVWQLHSDFGGFSDGVCDAMKITIADSNNIMILGTSSCKSPERLQRPMDTLILLYNTCTHANAHTHTHTHTCMHSLLIC